MGYRVYVTRAASFEEGAQLPIEQGDWRAVIEADPELEAPDEAYPSYAVWTGRTRLIKAWIDWADGNLFTHGPDDAVLRKLIGLATRWGASVQGQRGERYRLHGDEVVRDEPAPRPAPPIAAQQAASERWTELELEEIFERAEPHLTDDPHPPPPLSSETFFGPRPRNALEDLEVETDGLELHADASFARRPEENLPASRRAPRAEAAIDFSVGERVRTSWGRPATVVSIDRAADMGLGQIEIRYDDGRIAALSCVGHGLQPLDG